MPGERQATYGEVIAIREFSALWYGQGLSLLGDQFAQVALAVLVYERTRLPARHGRRLRADLPAVDRRAVRCWRAWPTGIARRGVMIGVRPDPRGAGRGSWRCRASRSRCCAGWSSCVVLLSAPFSAARAALLPEVLEGDRYVVGSALQNMTNQAVQMLGFAAGGALIATMGPYRALALDAATFLASALILVSGVRRRPAAARATATSRPCGR